MIYNLLISLRACYISGRIFIRSLARVTPVFTTIEGAAVPLKPAGPKRMIFVAVMMILAFVIQTVDGKQYLIGTADKPFPVIKVDDSTGKVDGDSAATKYTISYTNKVALVPCTA